MVPRPPSDGTFNGTSADGSQEELQRERGLVGAVGPETMVASGDAETSPVVVDDGPNERLEAQGSPESEDAAGKRDATDEDDIEPVDVLVPVFPGDGILGDVLLGRIVLGVAVWLRGLGHGRGLVGGKLRLDGLLAGDGLVRRHVVGGGRTDSCRAELR